MDARRGTMVLRQAYPQPPIGVLDMAGQPIPDLQWTARLCLIDRRGRLTIISEVPGFHSRDDAIAWLYARQRPQLA